MKDNRRKFMLSGVASVITSSFILESHKKALAHTNEINETNEVKNQAKHEPFMKMAIREAKKNPAFPFGAVIVDTKSGEVLATGYNDGRKDPTLHGEMAAMRNYLKKHGNKNWDKVTLYTTGEPCPMCMSALIWSNVKCIVWGSSVKQIRDSGIPQFDLSARQVAKSAASFYQPNELLGGVLEEQTSQLFKQRLIPPSTT